MRRSGWWWVLFVVAALAAVFFLITMIAAVGAAFSGHESVGPGIAAGVVLGVITALLAWLAWVAEHRARGRVHHHYPADVPVGEWSGGGGASAYPAYPDEPPVAPAPAGPKPRLPRSRRRRRNTPTSLLVDTLIFAAAVIGCAAGAVALAHEWRQSVATQDHGVAFAARVTDAFDIAHSSRSGTYHTTDLTVQFPYPVGDRTSATIKAPHREDQDTIGSTVDVRVDRSDPGHVELAGVSDTSPAGFIFLIVLGAIFLAITVAFAVAFRNLRRLRRHAAGAGVGGP